MKKLFLLLSIAVCCIVNASAQELTKKQFCIYFGQPKMVTTSTMVQSAIIEFDRSGRVSSKTMGPMKVVYSWSDDGKSIKCTGYNNGETIGTTNVRIFEMSEVRYSYEIDGVSYIVTFRGNGSINKMTMSGNGQSVSQTYYYESSDDYYPNKIVMSGGGQSMTTTFSNLKTDSQGNAISIIQSAQGQSMSSTNSIIYY